jgi:hypothetical protein
MNTDKPQTEWYTSLVSVRLEEKYEVQVSEKSFPKYKHLLQENYSE